MRTILPQSSVSIVTCTAIGRMRRLSSAAAMAGTVVGGHGGLPRVGDVHELEGHRLDVRQEVALGGGARERRVEHVPVLAPQRAVLEVVGDALPRRALQAGRIGPAVARQGNQRLACRSVGPVWRAVWGWAVWGERLGRAVLELAFHVSLGHGLQCRLRGLIADRLAHGTRRELHEVLFEDAHRGLQLEQPRLLLFERARGW